MTGPSPEHPLTAAPEKTPPTAVSVFPLPIYELVGSCRFAKLSSGKGEKGEGWGSPIRYVELVDVTDWEI